MNHRITRENFWIPKRLTTYKYGIQVNNNLIILSIKLQTIRFIEKKKWRSIEPPTKDPTYKVLPNPSSVSSIIWNSNQITTNRIYNNKWTKMMTNWKTITFNPCSQLLPVSSSSFVLLLKTSNKSTLPWLTLEF